MWVRGCVCSDTTWGFSPVEPRILLPESGPLPTLQVHFITSSFLLCQRMALWQHTHVGVIGNHPVVLPSIHPFAQFPLLKLGSGSIQSGRPTDLISDLICLLMTSVSQYDFYQLGMLSPGTHAFIKNTSRLYFPFYNSHSSFFFFFERNEDFSTDISISIGARAWYLPTRAHWKTTLDWCLSHVWPWPLFSHLINGTPF